MSLCLHRVCVCVRTRVEFAPRIALLTCFLYTDADPDLYTDTRTQKRYRCRHRHMDIDTDMPISMCVRLSHSDLDLNLITPRPHAMYKTLNPKQNPMTLNPKPCTSADPARRYCGEEARDCRQARVQELVRRLPRQPPPRPRATEGVFVYGRR